MGLKTDVGHGSHFSYRLARIAIAAGIIPDTLGADMHGYNTHVPAPKGTPGGDHPDDENHPFAGQAKFSLTQAMTSMLALGIDSEARRRDGHHQSGQDDPARERARHAEAGRGRGRLGARRPARPLQADRQREDRGDRRAAAATRRSACATACASRRPRRSCPRRWRLEEQCHGSRLGNVEQGGAQRRLRQQRRGHQQRRADRPPAMPPPKPIASRVPAGSTCHMARRRGSGGTCFLAPARPRRVSCSSTAATGSATAAKIFRI